MHSNVYLCRNGRRHSKNGGQMAAFSFPHVARSLLRVSLAFRSAVSHKAVRLVAARLVLLHAGAFGVGGGHARSGRMEGRPRSGWVGRRHAGGAGTRNLGA